MIRHSLVLSLLVCAVSTSLVVAQPSADVCNSSGGPTICVRFDNLGTPPQITTDFDLTFDGSGIPSVELLLGDNGAGTNYEWRVWSKDGSGNPAAINVIQGVGAEDYKVRILNPANGAGATTVTTINLDPSNTANYSRILAGNMTGSLSGNLTLQKASGGTGGEAEGLLIGGNMSGTINVPTIVAVTISGDCTGDVTAANLGADDFLLIEGDLGGDITVTGSMFGAMINVIGNVDNSATISVNSMLTGHSSAIELNGPSGSGNMEGDLILGNGIPFFQIVQIHGQLSAGASIDLTADDVDGFLFITEGGRGQIVNGGDVTGFVNLASSGFEWSGQANFANLRREFGIGAIIQAYDLSGDIQLSGDIRTDSMSDGFFAVVQITNDVTEDGRIHVGGSLDENGTIVVDNDMDGRISINGDVLDPPGGIFIFGDLLASGEIDIGGAMDADLAIGQSTQAGSLLAFEQGLDDDACIVINDSEGAFDADGNIRLGVASGTLGDILILGAIAVRDESGTGNNGDFTGDLRLNGCHTGNGDLNFCVDGTDSGSTMSSQTGCPNSYTIGTACVGGC